MVIPANGLHTSALRPDPPPYDSKLPLEGTRVLVVDDEPDASALAAMVLTQAGAHVGEANSAADALEVFLAGNFDVLVCDIGMPDQDGLSLIRQIRQLAGPRSRVRAMSLTAFGRPSDRHDSIAAGFEMHLVKPVAPSQLVAAVARLAGRDPT